MVKGITYILSNDNNLGPMVGANAAGDTNKVYPVIGTQKEKFPFITVWEVSRVPIKCKGQRPSNFNYVYEVHIYAKSYDQLSELADAVIDALEDKDTSAPINGVLFNGPIQNTNSRDGGFLETFQVYNKVLTFEALTSESPAT